MAEQPPPPSQPSVDSLSELKNAPDTPPASPVGLPREDVQRTKKLLLMAGGALYTTYALWLLVLMMILPSPTGAMASLVLFGSLSAAVGALGFFLVGVLMFFHILKAPVSIATRRLSLIKLVGVLVPIIALSAVTPVLIMREPALVLDILQPTRAEDFVAPMSVTLSIERAVDLLAKRGMRATKFIWDYDGDGKPNEETILPVTTAIYERQGAYTPFVTIQLDNGTTRRAGRRLTIPRVVFSVSPIRPIVDKPIRFSIEHLIAKPEDLKEARWDFDGDGTVDETTIHADVVYTYFAVDRIPVTVTVLLANQTQATFQRTIEVSDPEPLPFDVTMYSEPKHLIGPPTFGAVFRIDTQEPLREIEWSFGDGVGDRGPDLRRIGHVFDRPGIFPVTAKVRSMSGKLAEITQLVRVTEPLSLADLRLEGTPEVLGDVIRGEVPLSVSLKAVTTVPLIDFLWEAPNATSAVATGATVQAVYRVEGTYVLTLIAEDPQSKVLRKQIKVEALPPSVALVINSKPAGGVAPLHIQFDASESYIPADEEVAGFEWTFGDITDRDEQLAGARIEHTYDNPGEYTVILRAVMASGKEYTTQKKVVVRKPLLDACIQASRTLTVRVGQGIRFDPFCST
ncbi:MAG TPA: PKD domain-containing protein, partial [Candidatus Peribacteraceae bacterium]|nr:PKD domain-containing protein [Candidatus Peribacteraceae bacterium]